MNNKEKSSEKEQEKEQEKKQERKEYVKEFDYEKMLKYPHLGKKETKIWNQFIKENPNRFDTVWYDVKVGETRKCPQENQTPMMKRILQETKKRVDAIAWKGNKMSIIEIRPNANFSAIGEINCFAYLIQDEIQTFDTLNAIIVTDNEMPNMKNLCEKEGILLYVVNLKEAKNPALMNKEP